MAILSPVKKLFIPNKNMPAFSPYRYGTDMRAIENYVNNLAAPTPGAGYASLTGAGETVTPGDLTQAGGFTINDTAPDGIFLFSTGGSGGQIQMFAANGAFTDLSSIVTTSALIILQQVTGASTMNMQMGSGLWAAGTGSAANGVEVEDLGGGTPGVGFYGHAAVAQAAAPTTLADVITILTNLGLCA